MINMKSEVLDSISRADQCINDIEWIRVTFLDDDYNYTSLISKLNPTLEDLDVLDIDYDDGYGTPYLGDSSYVVFRDGSWLERYEYDGNEHWSYKSTPKWEDFR